jgi:hypothetical protein
LHQIVRTGTWTHLLLCLTVRFDFTLGLRGGFHSVYLSGFLQYTKQRTCRLFLRWIDVRCRRKKTSTPLFASLPPGGAFVLCSCSCCGFFMMFQSAPSCVVSIRMHHVHHGLQFFVAVAVPCGPSFVCTFRTCASRKGPKYMKTQDVGTASSIQKCIRT